MDYAVLRQPCDLVLLRRDGGDEIDAVLPGLPVVLELGARGRVRPRSPRHLLSLRHIPHRSCPGGSPVCLQPRCGSRERVPRRRTTRPCGRRYRLVASASRTARQAPAPRQPHCRSRCGRCCFRSACPIPQRTACGPRPAGRAGSRPGRAVALTRLIVALVAVADTRPTITGMADVADGNGSKIGPVAIRLNDIDAPEAGQACLWSGGGGRQRPSGAFGPVFDALTPGLPTNCPACRERLRLPAVAPVAARAIPVERRH